MEMAGEVEDRVGLQAAYLPTGSISFGRFESEALSWERRSLFSHNRYLEEVERFSTLGSVTQKKAYFEAHFKRRGLLRQASCLNSSLSEGHRSDGESEDRVNCTGDTYENRCVDARCGDLQEHGNSWVGFSPHEEYPVAAEGVSAAHDSDGGGGEVVFSSGLLGEDAISHGDKISEPNTQMMSYEEQDQELSEYGASCITVDSQVSVEPEHTNILHDVEHIEKEDVRNLDTENETGELPSMVAGPKTTNKGKPVTEHKPVKPKEKSLPSIAKRRQNPSTEKKLVRTHKKSGLSDPQKTKQERPSTLAASSVTHSISRFTRSEDSKDPILKARRTLPTKSENNLNARKSAITPKVVSGRTTAASQLSSRPTHVDTKSKLDLKTSRAPLGSKSSERGALKKEVVKAKMDNSTDGLNFKSTSRPALCCEPVSKASLRCTTPVRSSKPAKGSMGNRPTSSPNTPARSTISGTPKASPKFNPSGIMARSPVTSATKTGPSGQDKRTNGREISSRTSKKDEKSKTKLTPQPVNTKTRKDPNGSKVRRSTNGNVRKTKPPWLGA